MPWSEPAGEGHAQLAPQNENNIASPPRRGLSLRSRPRHGGELASRLDVNESQVSRDERNEYRGITLDRAQKILDVMGVTLTTTVAQAPDAAA